MLSNKNKLRVHFYRFSFLHCIQSMFRKEKDGKQFLSTISNIFNVQKLKTFNWFHSYETQCVYTRDRKILRKRERLDDCWFSAINRRGYKTNIYTYIYIYIQVYIPYWFAHAQLDQCPITIFSSQASTVAFWLSIRKIPYF